jgi:hypothetical protein
LSRIGNFGFISVSIFICLIITLVFGLTVCHTVATNVWQLPDGGEKAAQQMQFNKLNRELQAYIYRSTATIG